MASFVEEATLKIDDQSSGQVRAINKELDKLFRNVKRFQKLKILDTRAFKTAERQVGSLARALQKLPRQRTVNINVNQTGKVPRIPRQQPGRNSPGSGGGPRFQTPGLLRIAQATITSYGGIRVAGAALSAVNEAQAQDTREISLFRNDPQIRSIIEQSATVAALQTSRLSFTRNRQIATDLLLGGVGKRQLPEFTQIFANTESAIGALFPGLENSVTLFNNKMINLANSTEDVARSMQLVRGGAQGIAAAGESFNAPTTLAALRRSGLAPTISEKGLANFILLTDALGQNISSGITRLEKELFIPAAQAGAGSGIAKGAVKNLEAKGLRGFTQSEKTLFGQDPATFIEQVLAPRIRKQGIDTDDRAQLKTFLAEAGFNATSQRVLLQTLTSIDERQKQLETVRGLDPSNPDVGTEGNLALATTNLIKAFDTFAAVTLVPLAEKTAPLVNDLANFIEKVALTGSSIEQFGLAAGTAATALGVFKGGSALLKTLFNPLNASALALDGSAAALTRAAVALGGAGVADAIPGGPKGKGLFGKALTLGAVVSSVGAIVAALSDSAETTPTPDRIRRQLRDKGHGPEFGPDASEFFRQSSLDAFIEGPTKLQQAFSTGGAEAGTALQNGLVTGATGIADAMRNAIIAAGQQAAAAMGAAINNAQVRVTTPQQVPNTGATQKSG